MSSTLDVDVVLAAVIAHAVALSKADAGGTIYEFEATDEVFLPRASHGVSAAMIDSERHGVEMPVHIVHSVDEALKVIGAETEAN